MIPSVPRWEPQAPGESPLGYAYLSDSIPFVSDRVGQAQGATSPAKGLTSSVLRTPGEMGRHTRDQA